MNTDKMGRNNAAAAAKITTTPTITSKCRPLPLELWTRIVGFASEDLHHLARTWLSLRLVSHALKAATEKAFADSHLPHADIAFWLIKFHFHAYMMRNSLQYPNAISRREHFTDTAVKVEYVFDHICSEDRGLAVFVRKRWHNHDRLLRGWRAELRARSERRSRRRGREGGGAGAGEDVGEDVGGSESGSTGTCGCKCRGRGKGKQLSDDEAQAWEAGLRWYVEAEAEADVGTAECQPREQRAWRRGKRKFRDGMKRPPHVLSMRQASNDTRLPGLEVDHARGALTVRWKPMLSLLLGEEEYIRWAKNLDYQRDKALRQRLASIAELAMSNDGDLDPEEILTSLNRYNTRRNDRIFQAVRRWRIRQYRGENEKAGDGTVAEGQGRVPGLPPPRSVVVSEDDSEHNGDTDDDIKFHVVRRAREGKRTGRFMDDELGDNNPGRGNFYDDLNKYAEGRGEKRAPGCTDT